ncbi:MAG: glycosyltransferase family 2 protein [Desulfobacterales bacterium]
MGKTRSFQSTETEHHVNKERFISVVIPNHNGADTIAKCLEAVFSSDYSRFEAVVVDDFSTDSSVEIIKRFPCKLLRLEGHEGVSKARNKGARASSGELLFFTDNDCLLQKDALALANRTYNESNTRIIGGTYTRLPYDLNFFSLFQSIFINYFETKKKVPDYIAAHAMIIDADLFRKSGGFVENSFIGVAACVEDVEFIHRLCRDGCKLSMNPLIQVQHIFNFSFLKSLNNAVKKSRYWTLYSIFNKDLFADSGTASVELKINVGIFLTNTCLCLLYWLTGTAWIMTIIPFLFLFNLYVNKGLFGAFFNTKGLAFLVLAICYYTMIYPIAVGAGALLGAIQYLWDFKVFRKYES